MSELLLFGSSFVSVMLLVLQSIANNHGQATFAFFNSIAIGLAQLALYRLMPDANVSEVVAFLAGGPFGNVAAQWIKRHEIARIRALREGGKRGE